MSIAFISAAVEGNLPKVQRLLREGVACVNEVDIRGKSALWLAITNAPFQTAQWLLEYGGADTSFTVSGRSLWCILSFTFDGRAAENLLRGMLLRTSPSADFKTTWLALEASQLVQEGAQLRARLPAYLVQRRALLDAHCPLLPPLVALVSGYEEPTTTEELWAMRLGAAP
jgi:hypothetical protein